MKSAHRNSGTCRRASISWPLFVGLVILFSQLGLQGQSCNEASLLTAHVQGLFECLESSEDPDGKCLRQYVASQWTPGKPLKTHRDYQYWKDWQYTLHITRPALRAILSDYYRIAEVDSNGGDRIYIENIEWYGSRRMKLYIRNFRSPGRSGTLELLHYPKQRQPGSVAALGPPNNLKRHCPVDSVTRRQLFRDRWKIPTLEGLLTRYP